MKVNTDGTVDMVERSMAALARKVEWVRQAAGERFNDLELSILVGHVVITDDRRQAAEELARERGWIGVTAEQVLEMPYALVGTPDQIAENIQMWRERYNISYIVVYDEDTETFAPVIARLAGT